jgi:hypothetical protein
VSFGFILSHFFGNRFFLWLVFLGVGRFHATIEEVNRHNLAFWFAEWNHPIHHRPHPNIKGIVDPPCRVFGMEAPAPACAPGIVRIASLLIPAFITREERDTFGGTAAWMFTEYFVKSDKSTAGATTKMRIFFDRVGSIVMVGGIVTAEVEFEQANSKEEQ